MKHYEELQAYIESAWENKTTENLGTVLEEIFTEMDEGRLRVAERGEEGWRVHQWLKKAILLSFRVQQNMLGTFGGGVYYDKVPLKFEGWDEVRFQESGIRVVPGSIVRRSAYIGRDVVLMPSFVNVGAYVDQKSMVDSWSTIGSCAQIGRNVHVSGGVGIGGVLEPLQSNPVIIEDDCFIGARSEITEGVIVERGSVIAMGVFLSATTKIVYRETGEIIYGRVPEYSVVVPGSLPSRDTTQNFSIPSLACAVIIKQVDARTRARTAINELLRPE